MWLFLIHPADNRSAGRAHWSLRCVWSKKRGMWFGVKVLISWCFCLQSSWIVLYVFLWQEQAQQLCTSSFYNVNCLHSSPIFVTTDIRNRVLFVAGCPHSFCREEKVGWAPLIFSAQAVQRFCFSTEQWQLHNCRKLWVFSLAYRL